MKSLFYCVILAVVLCSCGHHTATAQVNTIHHQADYDVYLPKQFVSTKTYPLLFFCDPHAQGSVPLNLYRDLADSFDIILVGSNISGNGVDIILCQDHINKAIDEITHNYKIDSNNMSICGFSGGSYIAYHMAHFYPMFQNVIVSGTPFRPIPLPPYPNVLCFAGNADMNYSDLITLDDKLKDAKFSSKYLTIEFDGKHEWPPAETFYDAYIFLQSMHCYACKVSPNQQAFLTLNRAKKFDNELEKMLCYKKIIFMLDSTNAIDDIKNLSQKNLSNVIYKNLLAQKQAEIALESSKKEAYYKLFTTAGYDSMYWKKQVDSLQQTVSLSSAQIAMNKRLLGFLSLLGYSLTSKFLRQDQLPLCSLLLNFYKIVDTNNPDVEYLRSIYYMKLKDSASALTSLQASIDLGFNDFNKMEKEEAFASIRTSTEYQKFLARMKK